MEILCSFVGKIEEYIVGKIAEYTVAPIGRQVGYLLNYKDNFEELKDLIKELKEARDDAQSWVDDELRNGKEIEATMQNWLVEVNGTIEEAKKLCEDLHHEKVGCSKWLFPNLWWRHQLSKKAKKVTKKAATTKGKEKFPRIAHLSPPDVLESIANTHAYEGLELRKPIMSSIMQALAEPKESKIGVYGLGGVGKTTLVKQIALKAKNDSLFHTVIMASVTQALDYRRIQVELAEQLSLQFVEESELVRASRLYKRIKMEKSILIILDDIWDTLEWEKLGIPYPVTSNLFRGEAVSETDHMHCKVLLTSRKEDVLLKMETNKNFRLEVLNEDETRRLFEVMAGNVFKNPNLQHIATEVAKHCAGLPILVVTIARALKNKDIYAWKEALNELKRFENRELKDITDSVLKLSYNQLESDEVKSLFLLSGLMGPDVKDLLKYLIGLNIFKQINIVEDARTRLYKMISSLKASCLLLEDDTNAKFVKMHDIVRDVAISIASRDGRVFMRKQDSELKELPTRDFPERCSKIILRWCNIQTLPKRLDCPELELFLLNMTTNRFLEIPDSFFEGMGKLKVLDLTCMNIYSLPTSFCYLTNLQTLCLEGCVLGDIARIGTLKNLKILSLLESSIEELPSEIVQLTNLRMLDMSDSGISVIPPNIISNLTRLEELYMDNAFINWEDETSNRQRKNASLVELNQLPNLTALDINIQGASILPSDLMFDKLERYKITIGNVWEGVEEFETSKTLKLKLSSRIHLKYRIESLTKTVETLYMDEINGISNVLYQLNVEGFPLLKHLHIQNSGEIQHIINSLEWNPAQANVSFPNLEALMLQNLNNLEKLCHGPVAANSLGKLKVIKVKSCHQLKYLFSYSIVKGLPNLLDIEVSECNSMNKIVLMENDNILDNSTTTTLEFCKLQRLTLQRLPVVEDFYSNEFMSSVTEQKEKRLPFFGSKVAFPNLETLELSSINLDKIWDDGQLSATCGIQNLTSLIVKDCGNLKYLFSHSMIESLSNLRQLEISKCHMMEEIITVKEEGRRNRTAALEEVRFAKLEKIMIEEMEKLKTVWHHQFDRVKSIEIRKCEKLVCIFPSSMQRKFLFLETLAVSDCNSVKEIFELNVNEVDCGTNITKLGNLTLIRLPNLQQIWSIEPEGILSFYNPQVVHVESCDNLKYLFPLSIATGLEKLDTLRVRYCNYMTEVVANNGGHTKGIVRFVLKKLTTLELWGLIQLRGFYAGNHTLHCPSLKNINVIFCDKLVLYNTQSKSFEERDDDGKLHVSLQQPLFTAEEVIPNLESFALNGKDANAILQGGFSLQLINKLKGLWFFEFEDEQATFPYRFLQNVPNLDSLVIFDSFFKKIFQDERFVSDTGQSGCRTKLKVLWLKRLPELRYICKEGSRVDPILQVLKELYVGHCSNLINLLPSSVTFSSLEILEVENCNGLINLITSTTARSLVKLKAMKIKECNALEEVMKEEGCETNEDIAFNNLEVLEFIDLPQLSRFCSRNCLIKFPLLSEVVVRQCPRMKIFSLACTITSKLRKVQIQEENNTEWFWEDNLNGTIKHMFSNKVFIGKFSLQGFITFPSPSIMQVSFHSFKHLKLSEFPELKDLWYGQLQNNVFNNLKSMAVHECDFLSDVLFTSNLLQLVQNLEELEVKDCISIEVVFDVKGTTDKEVQVKQTTQLKKLTLFGLPKLKQIRTKSTSEIISLRNLCEVNVVGCESLENMFSVSLCQDLGHLEKLYIKQCGVEDIVAKDEGLMECMFSFPQLTAIWLSNLAKLKSFYPEKHTLECPSLKMLHVYHCEMLQTFTLKHSEFQHLHHVEEIDIPTQQALFSFEKVLPNLKMLALNGNDVWKLQNSHPKENLFHNIEGLCLQCFHKAQSVFSNDFVQRFPKLEGLLVHCSSFQTLFPLQEKGHHDAETLVQVKDLTLWKLDQLKYIWEECTLSDPLIQEVQSFQTPMFFKKITILDVCECKQLIYLFTSAIAKSLVQLRELRIKYCETIEDVMQYDEAETDAKITFENLEYLELSSLSRFKGFSFGKHSFLFPSLTNLKVTECPKMMLFSFGKIVAPTLRAVEVGNKRKRWQDDLNTTIKQLFIDKVIHNENGLKVDCKDAMIICNGQFLANLFHNIKALTLECFQEQFAFPTNFLERFTNLEKLEICDSWFKTILLCQRKDDDGSRMPSKIKHLSLKSLSQLKYIGGESQLDSLVRNLESLEILGCSSLKKLAPPSMSFQNLTTLVVDQCHQLFLLVTSSIARSFVQLTAMRIKNCKMIGEIVADEGDELEDEISFNCLASLELTNLESLKIFCSKNFTFNFPSLERVIVKNCPKMVAFCPRVLITPILKVVETEKGDAWEDNLNTTIQHLHVQMDIPEVDCEDIPELEYNDTPEI